MTLLHFEGWEDAWASKPGVSSVGLSLATGTGARTGVNGITLGTAPSTNHYTFQSAANQHERIIAGFAIRPSQQTSPVRRASLVQGGPPYTHTYISISNNASNVMRIEARHGNGDGLLGSVELANKPANQWYYIEIEASIANSTIVVRVDDVVVLNLTGVQTRNVNATAFHDGMRLHAIGTADHYDDIYVVNGAGAAPNNTFLGPVRAYRLLPNANGDASQWLGSDGNRVDNFALVNEAAADTATYVESATLGEMDLYHFGDLPAGLEGAQVAAVLTSLYAQKTDTGARSIRPVLKSGATVAGGADVALATGWVYLMQMFTINPVTGQPWTVAEINALQAGVEVR